MKCHKCNADNPDTQRFCGECGTQLIPTEEPCISPTKTLETPTEELTRGNTFANRYEIIEELGKGGMGKVYRVEDKKIKEEVALKLIKPEIASDKKTIERFSNELKIARKIAHRNVCRMYDLGEEKGTHYITMEYVPGEDLKRLIRKVGQFHTAKTVSIAKQVCEGLAEAHRLGVVHRDLKPQNIMIDKDGNARIMDFGIARSVGGKGITGAGVMIGTPEYMSPEQAEVKEVDQRSDIYSIGVILYEMTTGQLPFVGDTPLAVAMKHKGEAPQDPRELNPQIPEDLNHLILKCLEKDKERRYQSPEELLSELTKIEKGIPTTERIVPKRKPTTSKEIAVSFILKKLLIPASVIIALITAGVIVFKILPQKEAGPLQSGKRSIAVLPFEDLSPQKDQEYLCDGMAETLINALNNIEDLQVIPRTSAFPFKGKELDVREIGRKLNVDSILEGSMQKSGKRLRITARLISVEEGYPLWSEQYNREEEDVFAIQDEISMAIVDKLRIKLAGKEKTLLAKRYTEDLEAYNLYLKGRHFWSKTTPESLNEGIEYFQKAIDKDPTYALPYAGIADCYIILGLFYIAPKEAYPRAKETAERALEMDEGLAGAHASLGLVKMLYDWDWPAAEREFKRAIELDPNYATAHLWYSLYLTTMGMHDDSIIEAKRAQELDPISPITTWLLGTVFYYARQYDQAIEECQKALEIDPSNFMTHVLLSMAYIEKGAYNEAIAQLQKGMDISEKDSQPQIMRLIITYVVSGKTDELKRLFEELSKGSRQDYFSPYFIASLYLNFGQIDKTFEWLERAYEEHDHWIIALKVDPKFDNLRSEPRFTALLKKVGLE